MTRKDYPAIAAILARVRASYAPHWDPNLRRACDDHARAFADALGQDNARFERDRFLDDAGMPDIARTPYTRHVDTRGRHWWINEGHPDTNQEWCICRALSDGGHLLHSAIIARVDLTEYKP